VALPRELLAYLRRHSSLSGLDDLPDEPES